MENPLHVFADSFEFRTRDNGDVFWACRDGAPGWVRNIIWRAHNEALPCDWRYGKIADLAHELRDVDDLDAFEVSEWADGAADVYTHYLLKWLAGAAYALDAVDDAAREWGMDTRGIVEQILTGQVFMLNEIAALVVDQLRDRCEEYAAHLDGLTAGETEETH